MAEIVGYLALSHAPQLMLRPEQWGLLNNRTGEQLPIKPELERETFEVKLSKWQDCQSAIHQLRERLRELTPDVVLIMGDDQHENILDDNCPPFTIFIGEEAEATVSLRYLNESPEDKRTRYPVDTALGMFLIDQLMEMGFDPSYSRCTRYVGGLGHAFARPLKWLLPDGAGSGRSILPVMVNTYFPPAPSPKRCVQFGRALAAAARSFPEQRRIAIVASGGLSHTKLDEEIDRGFVQAIERNDADYLARMPSASLIEGTSEIRNWIVAAAAADRPATMVNYTPLYRTPTGVGVGMGFAYWS